VLVERTSGFCDLGRGAVTRWVGVAIAPPGGSEQQASRFITDRDAN
jgi:hypothetical protein